MATVGGEPVSLVDIVLCDICFEVMVKPQALNCLHHFCHTCTSRLVKVRMGAGKGVECPFCKRFTPEHEIQDSFMMNNLLDIYQRKESQEIHGDNKEGKVCLQCGRTGVSFYCKNCEVELCASCKDGHLRIPALKSHKVIALSDNKHDDQIIKVEKFCKLHAGNEIKYSCIPCRSAICAECKVESHDMHRTESVETALKAILDQAKGHIKAIHQNKVKVTHHLEKLNSVKVECESEYEAKRIEIEDHKASIVAKIEADYNELQECLEAEQTVRIKNIDIVVADVENQLSTMESLLTWSGAIISTTEGSGALCELQGGLLKRLEATASDKPPGAIARTAALQFRPTRINVEDNYIGVLIHPKPGMAERLEQAPPIAKPRPNVRQRIQIPPSSAASRQLTPHFRSHRETNFNFDSFQKSPLSTQFKKITYQDKFVLKNKSGSRLCLHKNLFWVPCLEENYIELWTMEGTLFCKIESDKLARPRSIHALDENNMILADQNGLFMIDSEMKVNKVIDGVFWDVHVRGEQVVALEKVDHHYSNWVNIFTKSDPLCREEPLIGKTTFSLDKNPVTGVMLISECVYGSFFKNNMDVYNDYVAKYSLNGEKVARFGWGGSGGPGYLDIPVLCAYDEQGSVLVVDVGNNRLQVLDAGGHWTVIHTLSDDHIILDVVFDGDQWMYVLCHDRNNLCTIVRYQI